MLLREGFSDGWDVNDTDMQNFYQIIDIFWIILAFVVPLGQSLYLSCMGFDLHGLIISIEDNQDAKDSSTLSGRSVRINSSEITGIEVVFNISHLDHF